MLRKYYKVGYFKISLLFLILVPVLATAQNIIKVEYFINNDPGYGNGFNIPVNPAPVIDNISFSADISGLSNGFHHLYVRSKDENG
ncbi:MAG: hypothetical protein K8R53_08715, partial [Bacteroidales bacterium]|nr:hypothetical protein [Bacteroidales bacterium]